jgi:hypothetical protein
LPKNLFNYPNQTQISIKHFCNTGNQIIKQFK